MDDKIDITKEIAKDNLRIAFNMFGIEGTEEKIKELYENNTRVKDYFLSIFWEMVRGEIND